MENKIRRNIYATLREQGITGPELHALMWAYVKADWSGMVQDDPHLMAFECQAPPEALKAAMEKHGVKRTKNGWWLHDHMPKEFGFGESMASNSMCANVFKDMIRYETETQEIILDYYPQLRPEFTKFKQTGAISKNSPNKAAAPKKQRTPKPTPPPSPPKQPLSEQPEVSWDAGPVDPTRYDEDF